jgi:hypothetical protein
MNCFHLIWPNVAKALEATYVSIEIAVVGAIIAWLQLEYAKRRDATLDARNQWDKIHRAMMEFRFRREVVNAPALAGQFGVSSESVLEAAHALHMLRAELDRAPVSPLVTQLSGFLNANFEAEKWRAPAFTVAFDNYAHEAALKSR